MVDALCRRGSLSSEGYIEPVPIMRTFSIGGMLSRAFATEEYILELEMSERVGVKRVVIERSD